MTRGRGSSNKINRINDMRVKILKKRRLLNLPDDIWKSIQNEQQPFGKSKEQHLPAEKRNVVDEKKLTFQNEKHLLNEKNNVDEEKLILQSKKDLFSENNNVVDEEKKAPTILKNLSVKLDNYLIFPNKWYSLIQKLSETIAINKSMYQNLIIAKQILVTCSVRTVIHKTNQVNSFTHQLLSADAKLEELIKGIQKQEDVLSNCKNIFDEVSLPLQIMNTLFTKDINKERFSIQLENKKIELQNEKEKHNFLQAELQKCKHKFSRINSAFKNSTQEKNKSILQLKLKLWTMKKRFLKMQKILKEDKKTFLNPVDSQVRQLRTLLIGLTHTMLGSISENEAPAANVVTTDQKDYTIKVQKQQLEELKLQNQQKNKKIKKLLDSLDQANKEKLKADTKNKIIVKEKDFKIEQLQSTLNGLRTKYDRSLSDRYYEHNLSIMLFEKIRQLERNQTAISNIKKFECKKDEI